MNSQRWMRLGAKAVHDIASISFGGGLAACLVINLMANRASSSEFATARQVFTAIAQYVLIPSVAVVAVSGLAAMMATRAYQDAGWVWVKAVVGISVLEAMLHSELNMLWLLVALCVINVFFAVWRPKLMITIR